MKVEVSARTDETPRCVYCREDVRPAEVDECPGCRTTLHLGCRAELGRCPTAGCADARVVTAPLEPGADAEEAERRRRREAARARRQAEDEARSARARATGERTRHVVEQARARADADRPWPGVHRPESRGELVLWLVAGAVVGLGLGFFGAILTSAHALDAAQAWRWVPAGTLVGLLEAGALALLGIRNEPLARTRYTTNKGRSWRHDAIPLVISCLVGAAVAGGGLGYLVAAEPGILAGALAAPLLALAPVLRWLGWN